MDPLSLGNLPAAAIQWHIYRLLTKGMKTKLRVFFFLLSLSGKEDHVYVEIRRGLFAVNEGESLVPTLLQENYFKKAVFDDAL